MNIFIWKYLKGWIILHQTKYLKKLNYKNFEFLLIICWCAFELGNSPTIKEDHAAIQGYLYFQVVGNFMHAIFNTRPNSSFVVNSLAQYLFNLGTIHIHALKRVM